MPIKKILIVDDSPTMRAMIASVLGGHADIEVVGSAADPLEARDVHGRELRLRNLAVIVAVQTRTLGAIGGADPAA
mgnify:CR=1 FL=1